MESTHSKGSKLARQRAEQLWEEIERCVHKEDEIAVITRYFEDIISEVVTTLISATARQL